MRLWNEVASKKKSEPSDRRDQRSLGRRVWPEKQNLKRQIQTQASKLVDWTIETSRHLISDKGRLPPIIVSVENAGTNGDRAQ
jgi:hypothetical protein